MKTLYLDCGMGAAGDMISGALLELLPDPDEFIAELNALGIPGLHVSQESCVRAGITGRRFVVELHGREEDDAHEHHHHEHRGLADIEAIIGSLPVSVWVKDNALAVYSAIAAAESRVHGRQVTEVHFHEVGMLDAVTDVVSACMLIERIAPERIAVSPICTGFGQVRCAHGVMPVPAPATALLLAGVPVFGGTVEGEMTTPTGAALATHFASEYSAMPAMSVSAVGYGMGGRDYGAASCVRAFLGETAEARETVSELRCNLDDMTPEGIGFALERLFEAGALDVWTQAIGMKKSRPGTMLCCLCRPEDEERMADLIIKHTTTLGVRISREGRITLRRETETRETALGPVRVKISRGRGVERVKPENEDLARIARERDISLSEAERLVNNK